MCSATTKMRRSVNQDETRQQRWNTEGAEPERSSTGAAADSSDDCGSTGNLGSSKNGEPPLGHQREHGVEGVAAKASLSRATGLSHREEHASASQMQKPRGRRRPDPLADIFDAEVVWLLKAAPGIRPVDVFEEMLRRHPDVSEGVRRNGGSVPGARSMATSRKSSFAMFMSPAAWG